MERWERIATAWDRDGYPRNTRALTGGMPVMDGETEYVRADLCAGVIDDAAVERLRASLWSMWGEGRQTTDWPSREELRVALVAALGGSR